MLESVLTRRDGPGGGGRDHYRLATEKTTFDGTYDADSVTVTLSIALALFSSIEMYLLMSSTFKRWKGLYCWSLFLCNTGVVLYALGIMLSYFSLCVEWLSATILNIGWVTMVTTQSLVLYSRLGLILDNPRLQRAVKWMIIFDSIMLCTLVLIFDYGSLYTQNKSLAAGYYYIERIQLIWLSIQELAISGLYIWKALALLRVISKDSLRTMIWQLFVINVLIIAMDVVLIALEFLDYQLYQETLKGFIYAIKLKLELNILSRLVDLVDNKSTRKERSMTLDVIDSTAINGAPQSDGQQELSWPGGLNNPFERDEKVDLNNVEDGHKSKNSSSGSFTKGPDDGDEISRVLSNRSKTTARTKGRESDVMYADILRAMN